MTLFPTAKNLSVANVMQQLLLTSRCVASWPLSVRDPPSRRPVFAMKSLKSQTLLANTHVGNANALQSRRGVSRFMKSLCFGSHATSRSDAIRASRCVHGLSVTGLPAAELPKLQAFKRSDVNMEPD